MRTFPKVLAILLALARPCAAADLKIATWDFGWLTLRPAGDPALPRRVGPRRAADMALLARYAAALAADVVAFQGIDGPQAAAAIFPPADYVIHISGDDVVQRTGFAVRRGLDAVAEPDLRALDPYPGARLRLRSGVDIALQLPGGRALRLLDVHLKAGCRDAALDDPARPACATLARQAGVLRDWAAARSRAGEAFLILGDFGRIMDGADAFLPIVAAGATLLRATEHRASPCWGGGNFVDHILAGGPARGFVQAGTLRVMVYRETGAEWRDRLSDHCPVSVRLSVPD